MSRIKLVLLWVLCLFATVIVLLPAMLVQALVGSESRALSMALAFDECGNALTGGPPIMTISARTGIAAQTGRRWGKLVAPMIDFFFGAGHCAAAAKAYQFIYSQH